MNTTKQKTIKKVKLSTLKPNPDNPRLIKDDKFYKLVESIKTFGEKMMPLRPIVIDENKIILGGNMRFKALKELGYKEIPADWIKQANDLSDDQKKEFIIKDNVGFGDWDWDILANEWESEGLDDWGINLPDFWDKEEIILDTDDIKKTDYLSIVVVAYEDVQDLDKITSLYELDSMDITEDIKSNITSQRKVYVFKK